MLISTQVILIPAWITNTGHFSHLLRVHPEIPIKIGVVGLPKVLKCYHFVPNVFRQVFFVTIPANHSQLLLLLYPRQAGIYNNIH